MALRGKKGYVRVGSCAHCGACCRNISLSIDGKKLYTEQEFDQLKAQEPIYGYFKPFARDDTGALLFECSALNEQNRCNIHSMRPSVCRSYPSLALMQQGKELPVNCGYRLYPPEDFEKLSQKYR